MNVLLETIKTDLEAALKGKDIQYFIIGNPENITEMTAKEVINKGALFVYPEKTSIGSVTTGLQEQESHSLHFVLVKNIQEGFYTNAQKESGFMYLARILDGRNADRSLKTNTVRYVVRNNMRRWGIKQGELDIDYDTKVLGDYADSYISGEMTLIQEDIYNQTIV